MVMPSGPVAVAQNAPQVNSVVPSVQDQGATEVSSGDDVRKSEFLMSISLSLRDVSDFVSTRI